MFIGLYDSMKVNGGWLLVLNVLFNRQAVGNASGKRHFVGIFQFTAKGNATGYGSYLNRTGL
jgi:hypothetical protein